MSQPERLPLLYPPGTKKNRAVSYDASGGNGFGIFLAQIKKYVDEKGDIVFFDAYGPGCLYREQMNIWTYLGIGAKNRNIRIKYYFDDDTEPRIDTLAYQFFNGECPPVTDPFAFRQNDQFGVVYYPFAFKKRLRITLSDTLLSKMVEENQEAWCSWFQFDYLTFPENVEVKTWTPGKADPYEQTVRNQWANMGIDPKAAEGNETVEKRFSIRPGEEAVVFDYEGQASIAGLHLKLTPFTPEIFYNTHIRIQWDDQSVPAVDLPVSYFFGGGGAKDGKWNEKLLTLLHGFDAGARTAYCYWPMPFWQHATVRLVNNSSENIDSLSCKITWKPASAFNYPRDKAGYFKMKLAKDLYKDGAVHRDSTRPYTVAFQEKGYGHVLAVNMWSGNYYEDGDEFTYLDGSRTPQIHGSGTEDDFNQGWLGGSYQKPLWGSLANGITGTYRISMNEPYVFYQSIEMRFEHTNSIPGPNYRNRNGTELTDIETEFVVWYYQASSDAVLALTDSLELGNPLDESVHAYKVAGLQDSKTLTQSYDSYERADNYNVVTDKGYAFNEYDTFKAKLTPDNKGVRLRKRIDRTGNGVQTANVYVDGKKLPLPWHIVTNSAHHGQTYPSEMAQLDQRDRTFDGWFDSEYEIPASYTQGKKDLEIRTEYIQSIKNELNVYHYWVYCYR
ncbi:MAG: DUF2961 domain-containing protein [Prevotellaceae bacterium]|nr:DUF2961 domain-containing protein [Prevotellaceae bacterium]